MSRRTARQLITPDLLLQAYSVGLFPMAEDADDPDLHWLDPRQRAVIPLDGLKVSTSLGKTLRRGRFEVRFDTAFDAVVAACAAPAEGRTKTWINGTIRALYGALHLQGNAHSVECWRDGELVGGLYGVSLGAAFFGESMFQRATDASKVALVHLVERLNRRGYRLLDAQFMTPHLRSLGAIEVARDDYRVMLREALRHDVRFD